MTLEKATIWLKFASWALIIFGLVSAISAHPSLNFLTRPLIQMALWPFADASSALSMEGRLIWAIAGGISIGWGVMTLQLTTKLLHKETEIVRSIILTSAIVWFICDGGASILSGAAFNAVLNIGFLALFLIPTWRPIASHHIGKDHASASLT